MPEQHQDRVLSVTPKGTEPVVLIIDNAYNQGEWIGGMEIGSELLGSVPFTYTSTVRCDFNSLDHSQYQEALQKCSVWTNFLLESRAVVLSTIEGLQQMKIEKVEEKSIGHVFRNARFGVIVVVPPLHTFNQGLVAAYQPKVDRALKEVKLK